MISQIRWLQEHPATRNYLASKFGLPMGQGNELVNGKIVSDGRSSQQLYDAFKVKPLQEFTGSQSTDVYELFAVAVEIAKAELNQTNEKPTSKENTPTTGPNGGHATSPAEKGKGGKRGRPKKS